MCFMASIASVALLDIRQAAYAHEVHFLEDTAVTIGGVRFLSATLWTDFEYFGEELRHTATLTAQRYMADYRLVTKN